ncbi:hypothetical protein XENOCAPTIV_007614, partial [Xenoophorus captivus]
LYESSCRELSPVKQLSQSSSISSSSSHGFSCCGRKRRKTFNVPNSNMSLGLQGSLQELSTIQIRERPITNRFSIQSECQIRGDAPSELRAAVPLPGCHQHSHTRHHARRRPILQFHRLLPGQHRSGFSSLESIRPPFPPNCCFLCRRAGLRLREQGLMMEDGASEEHLYH